MAKVLVTGAGGLLGAEFCQQLKTAGHEVWAIDDQSRSSTAPNCDTWIVTDLKNPDVFQHMLPRDFDYIYHYGAINGTPNFYNRPNEVLVNNFVSDINVFEFASQCTNLTRLVYASSAEVVADDPELPVKENTNVFIKDIHNARWSYRLAKLASENFLCNSTLPYVILRYFNIYGEESKNGDFLRDQIDKIQNGIFAVIGPQETRSFCYVSDAIQASIYVAENVNREIVNIGSDQEITIGDAVKIIAAELGHKNAIFEELPSNAGSVAKRKPDISKLKSIMPEYSPQNFKDCVEKIIGN